MLGACMRLFGVSVVLLSTACGTGGTGGAWFQGNHARHELAVGVQRYEQGDYTAAVVMLQQALRDGLSSKRDQVRAHKYLAFSYCITVRGKQCHESFKKALEIDPDFVLLPAEAGHPIWGPVFRSAKDKSAK